MICDVTVRFFLKALWATASVSAICASVWAASPNDLITEGDAFDVQLQASEALEYYLPVEELEPNNVCLLVRIARQYRHLMADATASNEKLRLGRIALNYAERAAALAPNDSEAQLSIAISYGKMLPLLGIKEQIEASRRIKDTLPTRP